MSKYEATRTAFNRRVNTQINLRMDGSGPTELAWEAWKAALAWRDSQGNLAAEVERLRAAIQRAEDAEKQLLEVAQIVHANSHPQQLRARLFNLLMRHMPDNPKT